MTTFCSCEQSVQTESKITLMVSYATSGPVLNADELLREENEAALHLPAHEITQLAGSTQGRHATLT